MKQDIEELKLITELVLGLSKLNVEAGGICGTQDFAPTLFKELLMTLDDREIRAVPKPVAPPTMENIMSKQGLAR